MIDFNSLRKSNIDTFASLAILVCADEPKIMRQIVEESGVTIRGVERFMERHPTLMKRSKFKGPIDGMGRPPLYVYSRTQKATRLLQKSGII